MMMLLRSEWAVLSGKEAFLRVGACAFPMMGRAALEARERMHTAGGRKDFY